jgi:hypothetical protein
MQCRQQQRSDRGLAAGVDETVATLKLADGRLKDAPRRAVGPAVPIQPGHMSGRVEVIGRRQHRPRRHRRADLRLG